MAFVSTGARLPCTLSVPYAPSSQTWRTSLFVVETTGCMALVLLREWRSARVGVGGCPFFVSSLRRWLTRDWRQAAVGLVRNH
jgi:hypothetical protein